MARVGDWPFAPITASSGHRLCVLTVRCCPGQGVNPTTGLYLASSIELPSTPERPSEAEARAMLNRIAGLLAEFPFNDTHASLPVKAESYSWAASWPARDVPQLSIPDLYSKPPRR